jgi:hypothetical protein
MMAIGQEKTEGRLVRPYTMTGGRTGKDLPPIALEAIVVATPHGQKMRNSLRWEASHIIDLTRAGTALVELAARLDIPIGVVRVIVADLAQRDFVKLTEPVDQDTPDMSEEYANLLKKVLDGINSL